LCLKLFFLGGELFPLGQPFPALKAGLIPVLAVEEIPPAQLLGDVLESGAQRRRLRVAGGTVR
jgi:hypothetical protein